MFKRMAASQHMNAEVAAMSAQVFSQFTHLVDLGAMVGYGETDKAEPITDDPTEALILDLLELTPGASGEITREQVELVIDRHTKLASQNGEIAALMHSWQRKRV